MDVVLVVAAAVAAAIVGDAMCTYTNSGPFFGYDDCLVDIGCRGITPVGWQVLYGG